MSLPRGFLPWWRFHCPDNAAKTDVAHAGVDHLWLARRGTVTEAVVRSAKVRTALDDPAGNADARLPRIVALVRRSDPWIDRRPTAGLHDFVGVMVDIPI